MRPAEFVYAFFALVCIVVIVSKSQSKFLMGLFAFWLFGYPIIVNPNYVIRIEVLNFEVQPNRIVLLPLILIVFFTWLKKIRRHIYNRKEKIDQFVFYEKWMIFYIFIVILSQLINYDTIGFRKFALTTSNTIVFLLFFIAAKWLITDIDFDLILGSIVVFATISAFVGLLQFLIDPEILRMGVTRYAFGNYVRSNGLFSAEYDQGFFQVAALIICFYKGHSRLLNLGFILLSAAAVFVTFHRLSWGAFFIALVLIGYYRLKIDRPSPAKVMFALSFMILFLTIGLQTSFNNDFISRLNERINSDTLTVRMVLNRFALNIIKSNPLGIGFYWTPYYNQLAYAAGMPFMKDQNGPVAGIVHNGFLSSGVLHGVAGLTAFFMFTCSNIIFYTTRFRNNKGYYFLPFSLGIIFLTYNLTQDFSDFGSQIMIFYSILLGCFTTYSIRDLENENHTYEYSLNEE